MPPPEITEQQLELQKQLNARVEEAIKLYDELAKSSGKTQTALQAALAKQQAIVSAKQQEIALLNQTDAQLQKLIDANEAILANKKRVESMSSEEISALNQQTQRYQELINVGKTFRDSEAQRLRTTIQQTAALANQAAAFNSLTQKIGAAAGLGTTFNQTVMGGIANSFGGIAFQLQGIISNLGQGKSAGELFKRTMIGIAGPVASATEQLLVAQDALRGQFVRSTGASERFTGSLMGASRQLKELGLDFRSAGAAQAELYNGMRMFKGATETTRTELTLFAGKMTEAGADTRGTVSALEFFTNNLRMSSGAAQRATSGIINMSQALGMNLNATLSQFNALAPTLAAHGNQMRSVFVQLASQARATGISMQDLVSVAGQFDTFDGAANAVGRLNGILGGPYLNSIKMVYATESQRMSMMHQSLQLSGRSFDSLSRYERKALTAAAGFRSVGEAQKFFNSSLHQYQAEASRAAAKQANLVELGRRTKTMAENLRLAMMKLAVSMEPLIGRITGIINGLSTFIGSTSGQAIAQFGLMAAAIIKVDSAVRALAASFGLMGMASRSILGPIGLVAAGIYTLTNAFTEENSPPAFQLPSIFASGLQSMGAASDTASVGLSKLRSSASGLTSFSTKVNDAAGSIRNLASGGAIQQLGALGSAMKSVEGATKGFVFGMQVSGFENIVIAADKLKEIGPEAAQTVSMFSNMVRTTANVEAADATHAVQIARAAEDYAKASVNVQMAGAQAITNMMVSTGAGGGGGGGVRVQPPQKVINQPINFNAGGRALAQTVLQIIQENGDVRVAPT